MNIFSYFQYGARSIIRDNFLTIKRTALLRTNENKSPSLLDVENRQKLAETLVCAARTLPRYRFLSGRKINEDNAVDILLRELPIIDKSDLVTYPEQYYPNGGRKRPWHQTGSTSGSSGTPLTVMRSLDSIIWEQAFVRRHWSWSGFAEGMPRAFMRGDLVVPSEQIEPPFWRMNTFNNQLFISSRHLSEQFIKHIIAELRRFKPHLIQAYPSTAFLLARHLESRGEYIDVPYIYTSSEPLYAHQVDLIQDRLQSRVMDLYGMAERVAFASACEYGNLHVNTDYAFVEIVDKYGEPTNGYGTVVGTTYFNHLMPLLRYQTSDITRWKAGDCACGRLFPMIEPVSGRVEEAVFDSLGRPASQFVCFAFKGVNQIEESQVAYVGPSEWEIRIVPFAGFGDSHKKKLIDNFHHLVDPMAKVSVRIVSVIPRSKAGKQRPVVNEYDKACESEIQV